MDRINDYYQSHKGKPILIAGCGPSMTNEIARSIKDKKVPTIGVNKCFMFDDMNFTPTYHLYNDHGSEFPYIYQDVLIDLSHRGSKLVFPAQVASEYRKGIKNPLLYWLCGIDEKYRFAVYDNPDEVVWFGRGLSIAFTALQFAVYLGANPICLIGVDFTLTNDYKVHPFDSISLPQKAAKRYEETAFPNRMKHLADVAAPALSSQGVNVYNLSKISKLDCWPKPDMSMERCLEWLSPLT